MGIASGETITEAPMTQRLSLTDRSTCEEGPAPPYTTLDRPVQVILAFFLREITRAPSVQSVIQSGASLTAIRRPVKGNVA